jgi:hypothetical protein
MGEESMTGRDFEDLLGPFGQGASIVLMIIAVTWVLWVFLPFAVFGIKGRLDMMIGQQREIIKLLTEAKKTREATPAKPAERVEPRF